MRKIIFSLFVPIILAGCNGSANITGDTAKQPQTDQDRFAACLTEKGAIFYGTEWCPHCTKQKELFGESMPFVNYVDCDKNKSDCNAAGVTGYPTWKIGDKPLVGTQPLAALGQATGCELNVTAATSNATSTASATATATAAATPEASGL